jgi:hypothetical protein
LREVLLCDKICFNGVYTHITKAKKGKKNGASSGIGSRYGKNPKGRSIGHTFNHNDIYTPA